MIAECLMPEPQLNLYGTATATSVIASPVKSVGMTTVDDGFATMPSLAAVPAPAPVPTYRPFDEEELHTSFEQAISDRVLAVKRMLQLHSHAHAVSGLLEQHTAPLARPTPASQREQTVVFEQPRKSQKSLALLPNKPWLRGLTYASLALLFMLVGFDLMGMLVLFAR
jgi:hypothetical protein